MKMVLIRDCETAFLPHPAYSPDLAIFDFSYFLTRIDTWLVAGKRTSLVLVQDTCKRTKMRLWGRGSVPGESTFILLFERIQALEERWEKCLLLKDDYDERQRFSLVLLNDNISRRITTVQYPFVGEIK